MPGSGGTSGYYRGKMRALRRRFGGRCVDRDKGLGDCSGRLEFSHLKPTGVQGRGRGRADRYHDILRNVAAFALRCVRHHRRFDLDPKNRPAADALATPETFELAGHGNDSNPDDYPED